VLYQSLSYTYPHTQNLSRKGLQRFLGYAVNHPVIKEDGLLAVFLSEPDFESWRRHTWISLDEESTTKRVESVQEMSIPSDLEAKLASTRQKIGALIEQWTRLCSTAERMLKRREAAAGELARVTMTMNALAEGNQSDPWGNVGDELSSGVNSGVLDVAGYLGRLADAMEGRSKIALGENLEALKVRPFLLWML
jgi:sorting nexin-8